MTDFDVLVGRLFWLAMAGVGILRCADLLLWKELIPTLQSIWKGILRVAKGRQARPPKESAA
jgi:hypothetical protein